MAEKIKSSITYKGFMIQEILMDGGTNVMRGPTSRPLPEPFIQWRIVALIGKRDRFTTASGRAEAELKIDSGEAQEVLSKEW